MVAADRWNSIKILSDIEELYEIQTVQHSLKYSEMSTFKDYLEDKQIQLPNPGRTIEEILKYDQAEYPKCFKDDPLGHFYLQLLTVQDTGISVTKGEQLTDDMVRAAMLAVTILTNDKYAEVWVDGQEQVQQTVDISSMAVSRGLSGGGSGRAGGMAMGGPAIGSVRRRS